MSAIDDHDERQIREEAAALAASDVSTRDLLARSIARSEYGIRLAESTRDAVAVGLMRAQEAQAEQAEQTGRLMAALARVAEAVGSPPTAGHAGSGLALLVHTLWSERRGAAVGALVGSGGAVGVIELARLIVEALR